MRGIHPENLERGSLGAGMGWPFLLGVVASLLAFVHLLSRRVEVAGLRMQVARKEAAQVRSAEGRPE